MKNLSVALIALTLIACGPSAEEVDQFQVISQKNAESNLRQFMKSVDKVLDYSIQSDSTVSSDCPAGDGWASGTIETPQGEKGVKCQTTGSGKGSNGCLWVTDFNKKDYVDQEGTCDKSLGKLRLLEK